MASKMVFDENYGNLPNKTLRLVKKYNVSPADFDYMLDQFMGNVDDGWQWVDQHIVDNSPNGYYTPRFF